MKKLMLLVIVLLLVLGSLIACGEPKCTTCYGRGSVTCVALLAANLYDTTHSRNCVLCNGTGEMMCDHCYGSGVEPQK